MSFKIVTDTGANLTEDIIEQLDLEVVSLNFYVRGVEYKSYEKGRETDLSRFYEMMRNKENITTSLPEPHEFIKTFDNILQNDIDILCITFSGGLSGTIQSANIAAVEMRDKYPQRKIIVVDSCAASLGEGLYVYNAAMMKKEGKSIEEVEKWLLENRDNICHWFTVDDLFFLMRGGRVSTAAAVVGSMLSIKPVMHVDNAGKLIPVSKVRGRKAALKALADKFEELAIEKENQTIAISHGDCLEDAMFVIDEIKKKHKVKEVIVNWVDPVIGAHSGPGTVALFFLGEHK